MSKRILAFFSIAIASVSFGQTEILNEDFQSGFPSGWTMIDVDQQIPNAEVSEYTSPWIIKTDPENPLDSVISCTSYYTPEGQANKWLITPAITLGAYGNILTWNVKSHDPSYPDSYKVLISLTGNDVASFTDTLRRVVLESPDWLTREVNMSELGYNGQTVYIAFVNTTNKGYKFYLDDIKVRKEDPLGIKEISMPEANIYPNPVQGSFKISGNYDIDRVAIYTTDGKLIRESAYSAGEQLDVQYLQPGIYLAKLMSGRSSATIRFIKK